MISVGDRDERAGELLRSVFGFHEFRDDQDRVIRSVLAGEDSLVLMPTGGGKSLCFQLPALLREGVAIVVSPLIALMQDQVSALEQYGVAASSLNSGMSPEERRRTWLRLRGGELKLLYVAPERLLRDGFLDELEALPIALFAIDEAHCISQWGHDFRPEYLQLAVLQERFEDVPIIALTATADGPTRKDIIERLRLREPKVFIGSFNRANIRYSVVPKERPKQQLLRFLREHHDGDAGIIYCLTRRKVDEIAEWLCGEGVRALPYHAGLAGGIRAANQKQFQLEEGIVVVATIAFGMGIDKSNVRFVAHLDMPASLQHYYQETGRAGRDGLPASAWLAYGWSDVMLAARRLQESEVGEEQLRIGRHKLDAMLGYCETASCRRKVLLAFFGEELPGPCGNCDCCLEPIETWDGTVTAQKALSNIFRTGQRFGKAHLVDVLLGKATDKVARFGHDRLSTFGIGEELDAGGWHSVYRQLAAMGYLRIDIEGHGGISLTSRSRPVLNGEEEVRLRRDPLPARSRVAKRGREARERRGKQELLAELNAGARELFERLRERRLELAHELDVPPYVIFHDTTLIGMAQQRPQTLNQMACVGGVGQVKLERYGRGFLEIIQSATAADPGADGQQLSVEDATE